MSDKTEDPTPRRLRKAREEGDSGASAYASQAVAFVVAVALAPAAVGALASRSRDELRSVIAAAAEHARGAPTAGRPFDAIELATAFVALSFPLLVSVGVAGAVVHLVQTGGVLASKRIGPKLERLNPFAGIKSLFSGTRLFAVARSLFAGGIVLWLAWAALRERIADIAGLASSAHFRAAGLAPSALAGGAYAIVVSETAGALAWRAALAGLALGVVDLLVTRRAWLRRLRMSKDEVRREYKEAEGDPQVKAARERAYQEMLAQATLANVRTASVVVVNPTHLACALRYDEKEGDQAPVVVASGEGDLAARIVQAARACGVPVVRDVPLARALAELEVGDVIPEALYEAVAEILREIWEGPSSPG